MQTDEPSARRSVKEQLETVTTVAVLIAAVLVAGYFGILFIQGDLMTQPRAVNGPPLGMRITPPEAHEFPRLKKTFILALSTKCSHCTADVPFYRELLSIFATANCSYEILSVFPNDEEEVDDYRAAHDFWPPSVADVALASFGVSGTPTVVLVDGQGVVEAVWVGELSPEREQEILSLVVPDSVCRGSDA